MTDNKFQKIKQLTGSKFLEYVLSLNQSIENIHSLENLRLTQSQLYCLSDLFDDVQKFRIDFVSEGNRGDGMNSYLRDGKKSKIFNAHRQRNGGVIPFVESGDGLLDYIKNICIQEYPVFLFKSQDPYNLFSPLLFEHSRNFYELLKNDVLYELTNKKNEDSCAFLFSLENDLQFNDKIFLAFGNLISCVFENSFLKMQYELEDILNEVEIQMQILRDLAESKEVEFSSFIGVRGLKIENRDVMDLGVAKVRYFDSRQNPGGFYGGVAAISSGDLFGCVLEIFHKTKVKHFAANIEMGKNSTMTQKIGNEQLKIVNNLKLALTLALEEDKGVSDSFFRNGFPLTGGTYEILGGVSPKKYLIIHKDNFKIIREWFELLSSDDAEFVEISINRLRYAIFERHDPEDAILDALIAWEGMFSGKFETSFKVTGSIVKFLYEKNERLGKLKRLGDLYGLRSAIVHGSKGNKLFQRESHLELRSEVIKIGLQCLKKLFKNKNLLKKEPKERVKEVLLNL